MAGDVPELRMYDPQGTTDYTLPQTPSRTTAELIREQGDEGFEIADFGSPADVIGLKPGVHRASDFPPAQLDAMHDREKLSGRSWRFMPSSPILYDEEVWHYTDAHGLIGSITSGELWASSLASMNDSAEYSHGLHLLAEIEEAALESRRIHPAQKELLREVVEAAGHDDVRASLFCLSASTQADSLSQWRDYGKGQGHALVLPTNVRLSVLADREATTRIPGALPDWQAVLYEEEDQVELLRAVCGFIVGCAVPEGIPAPNPSIPFDELASDLVRALSFCKNPSFANEHEARLIVRTEEASALRFRPGPTGVTPYVRLTGAQPTQTLTSTRGGLPLAGAWVGPFESRQDSARGVQTLLNTYQYPVEVSVSTSTAR